MLFVSDGCAIADEGILALIAAAGRLVRREGASIDRASGYFHRGKAPMKMI